MKFGITQGRLTNEKKNVLQKFPKKWENEFNFLKFTQLDYIELFLENKINLNNPIWSKIGQKKLLKKIKKTNLHHHIVCDNYILKKPLNNLNLIKYYKKLFKCIKAINCKILIIPIESKHFLRKNQNYLKKFLIFLKKESKKKNIKLSLEVCVNFNIFYKFLSNKKINNFKITFDTGNFFLINKNVLQSLEKYYPFINHIHLKDRNNNGKNVIFGNGKINFKNIFIFLKKKKYNKYFTFETNRGNIALDTATKNLEKINKLI